jgi:ankyrin repeat protein
MLMRHRMRIVLNSSLRSSGAIFVSAETLMRNGADVETVTVDERTPLWYAAAFGHTDILKALIRWGSKVNCGDVHGFHTFACCY